MRLYHQKGCKTWSVQFSIEGRKFSKSLGTRNKEIANTKALEMIKELQMEKDGLLRPKVERDTDQTPLLDLLQKWVDIGLPPHVIPKHRTNSLNRPAKVIKECGWKRICDITAEGFEACRTRYSQELG